MSDRFVSDPREVAKSGDIVRVKVLAVDADRKRIGLTMRLDDDPTERSGRGRAKPEDGQARDKTASREKKPTNRDKSGNRGKGGAGSGGQGRGGDSGALGAPSGAMADALRRAGFDNRSR
jgi:uncharacterized protein